MEQEVSLVDSLADSREVLEALATLRTCLISLAVDSVDHADRDLQDSPALERTWR